MIRKELFRSILIAYLAAWLAAGCAVHHKAVTESDSFIRVNLDRAYVTAHAKEIPWWQPPERHDSGPTPRLDGQPPTSGSGTYGADIFMDEDAVVAVVVVMVIVAGIVSVVQSIGHIGGTAVYVCPKGYPVYRQSIGWGVNRVAIPGHLSRMNFILVVDVEGNYAGSFDIRVSPGQEEVDLCEGDG